MVGWLADCFFISDFNKTASVGLMLHLYKSLALKELSSWISVCFCCVIFNAIIGILFLSRLISGAGIRIRTFDSLSLYHLYN